MDNLTPDLDWSMQSTRTNHTYLVKMHIFFFSYSLKVFVCLCVHICVCVGRGEGGKWLFILKKRAKINDMLSFRSCHNTISKSIKITFRYLIIENCKSKIKICDFNRQYLHIKKKKTYKEYTSSYWKIIKLLLLKLIIIYLKITHL